jgi:signal transduction histidine kinase/CheY-like chemotaxis protein
MGHAEAVLAEQVERLRLQAAAIASLARAVEACGDDLGAVMRAIVRSAAETLGCEQVGVWLLSADGSELVCKTQVRLASGAFADGTVLHARDYPRYFEALASGRAIDAHDAREDPRTSEFRAGYLEPLGITSMMDAAIRVGGRVIGVVCHEHMGPARVWTSDEVAFAGAIADQVALAIASDERQRLEEEREHMSQQLLHAQKLESLGVMAGGLAHDFNNLLGVIVGNVDYARSLSSDRALREPLEDALKAAARATNLTRQLLAYSGGTRLDRQSLDLAEQIREIAALVAASISKKVRITLELAPVPVVLADPTQLQQVIMNLMLNAAEAIGDASGEVRVTTALREPAPEERAAILVGADRVGGACVVLEVRDDGCGMAREGVESIFDPFFTTKGPGRGLGLSAVLGILQSHGAALGVRTAPGRGTSIRLYFAPLSQAAAVARISSIDELGGEGTVLVVDDEEDVGRAVERMLRTLGYQVRRARGCTEALREVARGGLADVVLLDLTMPDKSGIETLRYLRALHQELPVVLMSGYRERISTEALPAGEIVSFLQKPFTIAELARKLREALGAASCAAG